MEKDRLRYLLNKYSSGLGSPSERDELLEFLNRNETGAELYVADFIERQAPDDKIEAASLMPLINEVVSVDKYQETTTTTKVHRVHFFGRRLIRYAAAIMIICGTGAYIWYTNHQHGQTLAKANKLLPADIAPGGDRAILTLADGSTITLDSASDGQLAQQGNALVVKLANGQIAYDVKGLPEKEVMWNTMSTPTGGQYQVILPDGTKVWLNAASSITFPTAFVNDDRKVKITGEAYFEVAKNRQKAFIIDIDGKSLVEVLGTSFNINSYKNEEIIRTTLLEGSIAIHLLQSGSEAVRERLPAGKPEKQSTGSIILKPGEQAITGNAPGVTVKPGADISQILAWKNGIFDFTGSDLKAVMRQLERWYGIKVQYKGPVSSEVFEGKLYRNVNLSDALETLKKLGVRFESDGKNLIIL